MTINRATVYHFREAVSRAWDIFDTTENDRKVFKFQSWSLFQVLLYLSSYGKINKRGKYLAKPILAHCPPLRVAPLSPTRVSSPLDSRLKSSKRAHAFVTRSYFFSSNCSPKRIFLLIVPLKSHGSWLAYEMLPETWTEPLANLSSSRIKFRRELWKNMKLCIRRLYQNQLKARKKDTEDVIWN